MAYQLGDLHEAAGENAEALQEFNTALDSNPSGAMSVELLYRVGHSLEQQNDQTGLDQYSMQDPTKMYADKKPDE